MGRQPRDSAVPRKAISLRLRPETLRVLTERAEAKGVPVASYIADYLDRAAKVYLDS